MTFLPHDNFPDRVRNAEETLRLLARVPAPEGLVDRLQNNLRLASRGSFLRSWRLGLMNGWMYSPALRGAAATAIVCLVAGGGWRIYSHVQPAPTAKIIDIPARIGPNNGFSNSGAMRTPDTLNGPVLTHSTVPEMQNTVAPVPSAKPQTIVPKPKPAQSKSKTVMAPR